MSKSTAISCVRVPLIRSLTAAGVALRIDPPAELEHLAVQDLVFTGTAYLAHAVLPATVFPEKADSFSSTDRFRRPGGRAIGAAAGQVITVESALNKVGLCARADDETPRGAAGIPYARYEAAAHNLTNPVPAPFGRIPRFKYRAVRVARGGEVAPLAG